MAARLPNTAPTSQNQSHDRDRPSTFSTLRIGFGHCAFGCTPGLSAKARSDIAHLLEQR
jgi:hypothetical protein